MMAWSVFRGKCHSARQDTRIHTIGSLKLYLDVQAIKSFVDWVTFRAVFRRDVPIAAACCRVGDSRKFGISASAEYSSCCVSFLFLFLKKMNHETTTLISLKEAMKRWRRAPGREQVPSTVLRRWGLNNEQN